MMPFLGIKSIVTAATLTQLAGFVAAGEYWQAFNSSINPLNITIPQIPQTTSIDPVTECKYYNPDPSLFNVVASEWPTSWDIATSNGMNTSAEFTALYNSIDWANAPNISVRTVNADGSIDMTNYDTSNDPDCWWTSSGCTVPKLKDVNPDIYECPEPETWGLTYDDGPNCSHNAFYDFLEQQNLKASLFYIGSNVLDWPYGAMRGVRDGHHVSSHTWSHKMMTTLTNQELVAEFYYTQKAIHMATGVTPRYWRAPYGDVDDRVRWIATQLNLTSILWDLDTDDWAANVSPGVTTETIQQTYNNFIQMGNNGSMATHGNIVLSHEINNTTMSLALTNLPNIMKNYKHVVNVAVCSNITFPYLERTVAFPTFDEFVAQNSSAGGAASSIVGSNTNGGVTATGSAATQTSAKSDASIVGVSSMLFASLLFLSSVIYF